ncbi:MAG: hypothetical protein KME22_14930 [Hassallia sp. WJT32-NPBG1]|jgi:hypothetical protein|nr:hypothetical protein [Hassallia sp. WJT32-NPBG1]
MQENQKFSFLNYKGVLSTCLLLLSVAVPSTFSFLRVEAKVAINGDAVTKPIPDGSDRITPNTGYLLAKKSDCHAKFTANNKTTPDGEEWVDLGEVGGFLSFQNKKAKCLQKAKDHVSNLNFSTFGFTGQQICDNGGKLQVYIDTKVENKVNSRDDSINSNLQANCVCDLKYVP